MAVIHQDKYRMACGSEHRRHGQARSFIGFQGPQFIDLDREAAARQGYQGLDQLVERDLPANRKHCVLFPPIEGKALEFRAVQWQRNDGVAVQQRALSCAGLGDRRQLFQGTEDITSTGYRKIERVVVAIVDFGVLKGRSKFFRQTFWIRLNVLVCQEFIGIGARVLLENRDPFAKYRRPVSNELELWEARP